MIREVPSHIALALKNYDALLRLRFSLERKCWLLERKCEKRFLKKPVKYISDGNKGEIEVQLSHDSDAFVQFHDGYTDLRLAIPNPLPAVDILMENLYRSDTSRHGKYYIRRLEEQFEKEEQRREMHANAHFRDLSSHAWHEVNMAGSRDLRTMKNFKTK